MVNNLFILTSILILITSTSSDGPTPNVTLEEHMKKIDEILAAQKSESQTKEKALSAVLSNLLSQVIRNHGDLGNLEERQNATISRLEEKLGYLEISHNETVSKLEEKDAELSELWASHNATVSELHALRAKHNNVVVDLEETRSKLENLELRPNVNGYIGFHVRLTTGRKFSVNKPINFNKIVYAKGISFENDTEAYDKSTGMYLVQMNGTYLVWIDFTFQSGNSVVFMIKTKDGLLEKAYGSNFAAHGTASIIGLHYLHKGEAIWVAPSQDVVLDNLFCNFGAVLLNAY